MAKDHLIAGNENTADALLAGADALDTLIKVQDVLDRLSQECGRYDTVATRGRHGPYVSGYLDGLDTAHTWINEALGGTP